MKKSISLRYIVLLQAAVILYTCTDIAAKLASRYPFLSMGFVLCYGVEILTSAFTPSAGSDNKEGRHLRRLLQPRLGYLLVDAVGSSSVP